MDDPDGLTYMPNIPTEEVFTSPDRRRADGMISLTKPVIVGPAGAVRAAVTATVA